MLSGKSEIKSLFEAKGFSEDAFYINKALAGRPVVVYGAGECSHWFFEIVMKMYGVKPAHILDRRFSNGDVLNGAPASSPLDCQIDEKTKKDAIVVICVGNSSAHPEIKVSLERLGFRNAISLMDVYEIHNPFELPEELKNQGFRYFLDRKDEIFAAFGLFNDEESLDIYSRILKTHMTRKPSPLPFRPRKEQYFPKDVRLRRGHSRFVNCGSYDGDFVRLLNETCGKVEEIYCFEPEPEIFKRLSVFLSREKASLADRIVAMPCAVYSDDSARRFVNACGLGSRISESGTTMAQCVALDHALPGAKPTFICMDVEGAELHALKGAEGILRESRPDLAVCVYHSPNQLWEVPLWLRSLGLGYELRLRNYTGFNAETVLYASAP